MKRSGRLIIFTIFLSVSKLVQADCTQEIPNDGNFDFIKVTLRMKVSDTQKYRMLANSCEEFLLNDNNLLQSGRREIRKLGGLKSWASKNIVPMIGAQSAKTPLGNSEIEQEYQKKLFELRSIENPDERIHRVYLLAQKYQGKWVEKFKTREGSGILQSSVPGDVLKNAKETGSGGVCKDFSILLAWSLNQVSNSPKGIPRPQFYAEFTAYPGHAIVTIKSFDNPNSKIAKVYSLDPTNYQEFVPIPFPDLDSPDNDFDKRYDQCIEVRRCMQQNLNSSGSKTSGAIH